MDLHNFSKAFNFEFFALICFVSAYSDYIALGPFYKGKHDAVALDAVATTANSIKSCGRDNY